MAVKRTTSNRTYERARAPFGYHKDMKFTNGVCRKSNALKTLHSH